MLKRKNSGINFAVKLKQRKNTQFLEKYEPKLTKKVLDKECDL